MHVVCLPLAAKASRFGAPLQDAIDGAVTAAVGPDESCISAWKIRRFVPFNPVDKKTLAEVFNGRGAVVSWPGYVGRSVERLDACRLYTCLI